MELKVYLLCGDPLYSDKIVVGVYSHEYLAAEECAKLNTQGYPDVIYYVEERELRSA